MPYGETWIVENGLNAITDENGDGIADDVNHLFTGQEYDKETGLYYYNARYYDPHLGMFMRPDPAMDGLNHYAYANCNPVMYNDPTGMYDSAAATSHAASYGVSYGNDTSVSAGYSASYVSYMTSVHAASYGVNYNNDTTVNNKGLWFHVGVGLNDDSDFTDSIEESTGKESVNLNCMELEKEILKVAKKVRRRYVHLIKDRKGLYKKGDPGWGTHQGEFIKDQKRLNDLIDKYKENNCDGGDNVPVWVRDWAKIPMPDKPGYEANQKALESIGVIGVTTILGYIIIKSIINRSVPIYININYFLMSNPDLHYYNKYSIFDIKSQQL